MNSRASYDLLAISAHLSPIVNRISPAEVHLYAYLSFILYLYNDNPSDDWGYPFAATVLGSPYSADLNEAIEISTRAGLIDARDRLLTISESGSRELELLSTLSQFQRRLEFIEAACSSVLAMPMGLMRAAVNQIPTMKSSRQLQASRYLVDDAALVHLQHQIGSIRDALGSMSEDLLTPAITWIMHFGQQDLIDDPC